MATESKASTWITFIGVVFLLIGIYATARTAINTTMFAKYPTIGVLSLFNSNYFPPREEDCMNPQIYYLADGRTTRPAAPEEKANEVINQKSCVASIAEQRNGAKVNDISQALLFLFLGAGVLWTRKIFFK